MLITPPRLTLAPFLASWTKTTSTVSVNLMVVPTGDPFASLTSGLPLPPAAPFVSAHLVVTARFSTNVGALPMRSSIDASFDFTLPDPPDRAAHFTRLKNQFTITRPDATPTRKASKTVRKFLPKSYREAFAFVAPSTPLAVVDDAYHCALTCPPKSPPSLDPKPKPDVGWSEALAFVTRQPLLARAMGVLYTLELPLTPAELLAAGGWLFFDLAAGSDYAVAAATPGFCVSYATRIPALDDERPLFTPVLFPVSADAAEASTRGDFDRVFAEAVRFDDGFAKIVHGTQQRTIDPTKEAEPAQGKPREEGIALGWDDETTVEAVNRQIGLNPDGTTPVEAPLGVAGYRVDGRLAGDTVWHTLCAAHADALTYGAPLGSFDGELRVEAPPTRLDDSLWLPAWLTTWSGPSLVVRTPEQKALANIPSTTVSNYSPVGPGVDLRYGQDYEVRVRLVDPAGSGPVSSDDPVYGSEAPIARVAFRRYVRPRAVTVTDRGPAGWSISRPMLGYPEAVLAGAPDAEARLLAIHQANDAAHTFTPVQIVDPDVPAVLIRVYVRTPAFDPEGGQNGWRLWYETTRPYPGDGSSELTLDAEFLDAARLADVDVTAQAGAEGGVTGPLLLATARDLRLEISALGKNDLSYFAVDDARHGPVTLLDLHLPASGEEGLLEPLAPSDGVRSVFLRPAPAGGEATQAALAVQNDAGVVLPARFAAATGLAEDDGTILGPRGTRVVFAAATTLGHVRAPDGSGIALTSRGDLAQQWVSTVRFRIARDWTWKGWSGAAKLTRRIRLLPAGTPAAVSGSVAVAEAHFVHAVNGQATTGEVTRDFTDLVFLDAFTPPLSTSGFPHELAVEWTLTWTLENGESIAETRSVTLPVTTPPRQTPAVVAAGYALSPYKADDAYSRSEARSRMLWLEFDAAPADPRDRYFVRFLAHSPDPLLLPQAEPIPDTPSFAQWTLDPEPVRVITPGQPDDFAGLGTMLELIPAAGSDRHYLVPLPANTHPESPELFGFYAVELRVGHAAGSVSEPFWSTAQGRFGPSEQLEGLQFPAPGLPLFVTRTNDAIVATAPFACPWHEGQRLLPRQPATELWFVLYAQVWQADRAARRNVELLTVRGQRLHQRRPTTKVRATLPRDVSGGASFSRADVAARLEELGLAADAPLSVLAVELLPEPNGAFLDPLGGDLGEVRILRASPLSPVSVTCC